MPAPASPDSSPGLQAPSATPLAGDTSAHGTAPRGGGGSDGMPNTGPKTRVGPRVIEIAVTDEGFDPPDPEVRRGEAVTLAITRKTERTCAVDAIFPRLGKHVDLPMNQTVRVDIPAGAVTDTLYFACGMNMIPGHGARALGRAAGAGVASPYSKGAGMKPSFQREWPALLALAVTIGISIVAWGALPEVVPTHWGLSGRPDAWGSRATRRDLRARPRRRDLRAAVVPAAPRSHAPRHPGRHRRDARPADRDDVVLRRSPGPRHPRRHGPRAEHRAGDHGARRRAVRPDRVRARWGSDRTGSSASARRGRCRAASRGTTRTARPAGCSS